MILYAIIKVNYIYILKKTGGDTMDAKLLGQRIKEARLAKKMTQNEVVGSFITRNMLSQIESGNAVPSMKTLTYLAKVLDIPPSTLLSGMSGEEGTDQAGTDTLSSLSLTEPVVCPDALSLYRAKEAYLSGEDSDAYNGLTSIPDTSVLTDEANALLAKVALRIATTLHEAGQYAEALDYAKNAAGAAAKGIHASLEVKSQALLLLSDAAAKLARI